MRVYTIHSQQKLKALAKSNIFWKKFFTPQSSSQLLHSIFFSKKVNVCVASLNFIFFSEFNSLYNISMNANMAKYGNFYTTNHIIQFIMQDCSISCHF